jgi:hypothetical protein
MRLGTQTSFLWRPSPWGRSEKTIFDAFLNINAQMYDSIIAVEGSVLPDGYKVFERAVGHGMAEVFEQVVLPICKRIPPLSLLQWTVNGI